jgi:hypothetical protein
MDLFRQCVAKRVNIKRKTSFMILNHNYIRRANIGFEDILCRNPHPAVNVRERRFSAYYRNTLIAEEILLIARELFY